MRQNYKPKYYITIGAAVISIVIVVFFYYVNKKLPQQNPNVFLNFQYVSDDYYQIEINDSLIIDSDSIKKLKYTNEHYKTKTLNLKLNEGSYVIKIKNSSEKVLSESIFNIENSKPKYIYLRKMILIKNEPYILI